MNQSDFMRNVKCLHCKMDINQRGATANEEVCCCRNSRKLVFGSIKGNPKCGTNTVFELKVNNDYSIVINTYATLLDSPFFYVANPKEILYPLFEQNGIPDWIFEPVDKLIIKLETLITFS